MSETDAGIFGGSASLDEIIFVVFDQAGPEGLQEILAQLTHDHLPYGAIAASFARVGLLEAADIVAEAAEQAKPLLVTTCSNYGKQESPIHRQYWMKTNQARFTPEDYQYLEHNDPETFRDLTRKKGKLH